MRKLKRGFTLVELMVVLVILGIMAAVTAPAISTYFRRADFMSNEDGAKTIYLSAQSALTNRKTSGELAELQDTLEALSGNTDSAGVVSDSILPSGSGSLLDGSTVYYLKKDAGAADDEYEQLLCDMLEPYLYNREILNYAICVELDPESGTVYSATYSDRANSFTYGGATGVGDESNANITYRDYDARRDKTLVGYYSADLIDAGAELDTITLHNVSLENDDELYIHFEMEPAVLAGILKDESYTYTFTLTDTADSDNYIKLTVAGGVSNAGAIELVNTLGGRLDSVAVAAKYKGYNGDTKSLSGSYSFEAVKSSDDNGYVLSDDSYEGYNLIIDKYDPDAAELFEAAMSLYSGDYLTEYMDAAESTDSITRFGMCAATLKLEGTINANPYLSKTEYGSQYASSLYSDTSSGIVYDQSDTKIDSGLISGIVGAVTGRNTAEIKYLRNLSNIRYDIVRTGTVYDTANYREYTVTGSISAIDVDGSGSADDGYSDGDREDFWAIGQLNGTLTASSGGISDMNIVCEESDRVGLFRENLGEIKDISIKNISTEGEASVGTLCGINSGTVSKVSVYSSAVAGTSYVGGIIGKDEPISGAGTEYQDLYFGETADTEAVTGTSYVGGIIGSISDGCDIFRGCKNHGTVKVSAAGEYIGGIVGYADTDITADTNEYISCANYGSIIIDTRSEYIGGITGYNNAHAITNAVNQGDIIINAAGSEYIGGITGYNTGVITSATDEGNSARDTNSGDIYSLSVYSLSATTANPAPSANYVGGVAGYNGGTIGTDEDDKCISTGVILSSGSYIGGIAGYNAASIAYGESKPDGEDYYLVRDDSNAITDTRTDLLKGTYVGGIAGLNYGSITGSNTTGGMILGGSYVGGITGVNTGSISGHENKASVIGDSYVGGITGVSAAVSSGNTPTIASLNPSSYSITDCKNSGVAAAVSGYAGGITGVNTGAITNCTVSSSESGLTWTDITDYWQCGGDYAGGIAGYNNGAITTNGEEVTAYVVGGGYVGGYAGFNDTDGTIDSVRLQYAHVSGTGSFVGGVIGLNASAAIFDGTPDFYARPYIVSGGHVTDNGGVYELTDGYFVGGIIGANIINTGSSVGMKVNTEITDTTQIGEVTGNAFVGGMIGYSAISSSDAASEALSVIDSYINNPDGFYNTYARNDLSDKNSDTAPSFTIDAESKNLLAVKADTIAGGVIGMADGASSMTVTDTVNYASVTALGSDTDGYSGKVTISVGDLADDEPITTEQSFVGGIAGINSYNSAIDGCENYGAVTAQGGYIGGITAVNENIISECTAENASADSYIGGIAGLNRGTISDSQIGTDSPAPTATPIITAAHHIGGIAAVNLKDDTESSGIISGCKVYGYEIESTGDISTDPEAGSLAGGITAYNIGGTVSDSSVSKTAVKGSADCIGGIIGRNIAGSLTGEITTDEDTSVTSEGSLAGGIIGVNINMPAPEDSTEIINNASVSAAMGYAGGIAAVNLSANDEDCVITNAENYGTVTAESGDAGGITAVNTGLLQLCKSLGAVTAEDGRSGGITAVNGIGASVLGCTVKNADDTNPTVYTGSTAVGGIAAVSFGSIGVYQPDTIAVLFPDITYSSVNGVTIHHTGTDGYIGAAAGANISADADGASVTDVRIKDVTVETEQEDICVYMGAAAGFNSGNISGDTLVTAKINADNLPNGAIGGIVGKNVGTVSGMSFAGTVQGAGAGTDSDTGSDCGTGGIVGVNGGDFSGSFEYTIEDVTVTADVNLYDEQAAIIDCTLTAEDGETTAVTGGGEAASDSYTHTGGIAGYNEQYSKIEDSALDNGDGYIEITAEMGNIGGIAGTNDSDINGCTEYVEDNPDDNTASAEFEAERVQYQTMPVSTAIPDDWQDAKSDGFGVYIGLSGGGTNDAAGGIVGANLKNGSIGNIIAGTLDGSGWYVESSAGASGGIAGTNESIEDIRYVTNSCAVRGDTAGGIVGVQQTNDSNGCLMYNCVNNGYIKSQQYGGGFVGEYKRYGITLQTCINNGYVTATDAGAGFVGYMSNPTGDCIFLDCVNTGAITADNAVGIAPARMLGTANIIMDNCRSYGNTTGAYTCATTAQMSNMLFVAADNIGADTANLGYTGEDEDNCLYFTDGEQIKSVYYISGSAVSERKALMGTADDTDVFMWLVDTDTDSNPRYTIENDLFKTYDGSDYESVTDNAYENSVNHSSGAAVYDAMDADSQEFIKTAEQPYLIAYYPNTSSTTAAFYEVYEPSESIKASSNRMGWISNSGADFAGWVDGSSNSYSAGDSIPESAFTEVFDSDITARARTLKMYAVYDDSGQAGLFGTSEPIVELLSDSPIEEIAEESAAAVTVSAEYAKGAYSISWSSVPEASEYDVRIILGDGSSVYSLTTSANKISYTPNSAYSGESFRVQVCAICGGTAGVWSESAEYQMITVMDMPTLTAEVNADGTATVYPSENRKADIDWQITLTGEGATVKLTAANPIAAVPTGKYTLSASPITESGAAAVLNGIGETADSELEINVLPDEELTVKSVEWTGETAEDLACEAVLESRIGNYQIRAELVTAEDWWIYAGTAVSENPEDERYEYLPEGTVISYTTVSVPVNGEFRVSLEDIPDFALGGEVELVTRPWSDGDFTNTYHYLTAVSGGWSDTIRGAVFTDDELKQADGYYYVRTAEDNTPYYSTELPNTAAADITVPSRENKPVIRESAEPVMSGDKLTYRFEWDSYEEIAQYTEELYHEAYDGAVYEIKLYGQADEAGTRRTLIDSRTDYTEKEYIPDPYTVNLNYPYLHIEVTRPAQGSTVGMTAEYTCKTVQRLSRITAVTITHESGIDYTVSWTRGQNTWDNPVSSGGGLGGWRIWGSVIDDNGETERIAVYPSVTEVEAPDGELFETAADGSIVYTNGVPIPLDDNLVCYYEDGKYCLYIKPELTRVSAGFDTAAGMTAEIFVNAYQAPNSSVIGSEDGAAAKITVPKLLAVPSGLTVEWINRESDSWHIGSDGGEYYYGYGDEAGTLFGISVKNPEPQDASYGYELAMNVYESEEDAKSGKNPLITDIAGTIKGADGEYMLSEEDNFTAEYAGRYVGIKLCAVSEVGVASDYSEPYVLKLPKAVIAAPNLKETRGEQSITAEIDGEEAELTSTQTTVSWDIAPFADKYEIDVYANGSDKPSSITIEKNGGAWDILGGVDGKSRTNANGTVTHTYNTAVVDGRSLYRVSRVSRKDSKGTTKEGASYIITADMNESFKKNPYNNVLRIDVTDTKIILILPDVEISEYSGGKLVIRENVTDKIEVKAVSTEESERYGDSDKTIIEWEAA